MQQLGCPDVSTQALQLHTNLLRVFQIMAPAQWTGYDYSSELDEVRNVAREFLDGCVVEALDVSQEVLLFI